jgi:hypothetical protein
MKEDKSIESLNIFYEKRYLNKDLANFNKEKLNENK